MKRMVKKAQIHFICITLTILLVIFAALGGSAYYICRASCHSSIIEKLTRIENAYAFSFREDAPLTAHEGIVVLKTPNSYPYKVLDGTNLFSLTEISDIVTEAFGNYPEISASAIGKVYYRISIVQSGHLLVAADMTVYFDKATDNILRMIGFLIVFYLILALLVWLTSYTIFNPLKEAVYKQQKFVSDASHELKTPIAVISANADVLKAADDNKYVQSIKSQTKRLNLLVTDMLTLARMEESKTRPAKEKLNLSELITETVLPFDAAAFENDKILLSEIDENFYYECDRNDVKQIVNILLDNAIKYSTKGGTIKVTLIKNVLTVSNSGSDVKDVDSDRIFERFYRGEESRSRDTGGSGLGLSIAKSLAVKNKWNISAKSRYKESMTITVSF